MIVGLLPIREAFVLLDRQCEIAGVHTDGPKTAHKRFAEGYHFCTLLNDVRVLAIGATNWIRETRGEKAVAASKSY